MPVEFGKLVKGDTVTAGRTPHYPKNSIVPFFKPGEELQVVEVHKGDSGVKVQNAKGVKADYMFDHGAEKLEYTSKTLVAIEDRAAFAAKQKLEDGDEGPTITELHESMADVLAELKATKSALKTAQGQIADLQKPKTQQ